MNLHLLLAEDDTVLANALVDKLSLAGFTVEHAENGPVAQYLLRKHQFDVAILDLGLPMVDGLSVLKEIRATRPDLPVLILTALDQIDSRVAGLNAGADDYVTKPFAFTELEARVHAVLRRMRPPPPPPELSHANVSFDRTARCARVDGSPIDLSPREAILLELLLGNAENVVTKAQIANAWSEPGNDAGAATSAEVHIHRLRRKLEGSQITIRTVRGLGYLLQQTRVQAQGPTV